MQLSLFPNLCPRGCSHFLKRPLTFPKPLRHVPSCLLGILGTAVGKEAAEPGWAGIQKPTGSFREVRNASVGSPPMLIKKKEELLNILSFKSIININAYYTELIKLSWKLVTGYAN